MESSRIEFYAKLGIVLALLLVGGVGFNGYQDIDKRFFVVAMGVDQGKDGMPYEVTLQLAVPQQDPKAGKNQSVLLSRSAGSIASAISVMKSEVDKEFDFGHMKLILVGDKIVERNWIKTMDWFWRRRDIQKVSFVAVARPDVRSVLSVKPKFERLPANSFFIAFGEEGTETPYLVTEYLFDLHRRLHERGIHPVVPIVEPHENQARIQTGYVVTSDGAQLELTPKETALYSMLLGRSATATLSAESNGRSFSVAADEIHIEHKLSGGREPKIVAQGMIKGILESAEERVPNEQLPLYAKALERQVNHDIESFLRRLQSSQVDPIGFGLRYRATSFDNANEWDRWLGLYPRAAVDSRVRVVLSTPGIIE